MTWDELTDLLYNAYADGLANEQDWQILANLDGHLLTPKSVTKDYKQHTITIDLEDSEA